MTMEDFPVGGDALWFLPVALLVYGVAFGLIPGLLLRLFVLLYPKGDPRRRELFGELQAPEKGRFERYVWVFEQLETGLRDGLEARRDIRRVRKEAQNLHRQLRFQRNEPQPPSALFTTSIETTTTLTKRLEWATQRRLDHRPCGVRIRLSRVILEIAIHSGVPTPLGVELGIPISQGELGTLIAAKPDAVSVALRSLREEGLISVGYRRLQILDMAKLHAAAAGE